MDRLSDVLELAPLLKAKGEAFVLATVVRTVAATAAKAGAKAIIRADGSISEGWIGGGCARGAVLKAAREALADGRARLISVQPPDVLQAHGVAAGEEREGVRFAKNTCPSQGTMDIFIEPVLPRPQIVLCGSSPVAVAIADLAPRLGFSVTACAPAAEQAAFAASRPANRRLRAARNRGGRALHCRLDAEPGRRESADRSALDRRPLRRLRRQPVESADAESGAGGARRRQRASGRVCARRPGSISAPSARRKSRSRSSPRSSPSAAAANSRARAHDVERLPRRAGAVPTRNRRQEHAAVVRRSGGAAAGAPPRPPLRTPARADRALRRVGDALGRARMALVLHAGDLSHDALRRAGLDRPRGSGGEAAEPAQRGSDRGTGALAACACHLAMLIGMASALGAGPELAGAAGLPWTGGAAIAAMAFGMVCGTAAASACGAISRPCGPEADAIGA